MIFLDTNILVYAISTAPEDARKHTLARNLVGAGGFALSVQVVQEFIDVAARKKRLGIPGEAIWEAVELLLSYPMANTTPQLVRTAFDLHKRYQIRYWDAAILAAAAKLGCSTLYTEDLSHGQTYDAVQVINPFL